MGQIHAKFRPGIAAMTRSVPKRTIGQAGQRCVKKGNLERQARGCDMAILTAEQLRSIIILAHGTATGKWMIQTDTEMRRRTGAILHKAIMDDDIMRGYMGFGGPCEDRDFMRGSGSLEEDV